MKKLLVSTASAIVALSMIAPAFAESSSSAMSRSNSGKKPAVRDGACIAAAVLKRDNAISAELQKVVDALKKRGTDSSTAWTNSDKTGVQNAKKAFEGTWKTFNTTRKAAWDTFKSESKACKVVPGMTNTDAPAGEAGL